MQQSVFPHGRLWHDNTTPSPTFVLAAGRATPKATP